MDYRAFGPARSAGLGSLLAVSLVFSAACGGKDKKKSEDPTSKIGNSAPQALVVPKVDPSLCDPKGKKVSTFDLNRDNKPDVWKLFKTSEQGGTTVEILTCKQYDYDHDGRKDYIVLLADTGEVIAEEFDFTFEGHIDARQHYDKKTGKIYLVERDSDHDSKPDIWEKFDNSGVIESVRRDRNADGKPDVWEQYEKGELVAILYDNDFDNRVDRKEVRAQPAAKDNKPPETGSSNPPPIDEKKPEDTPAPAKPEDKPAGGAAPQ